jgi:aminopeptidase-like protein
VDVGQGQRHAYGLSFGKDGEGSDKKMEPRLGERGLYPTIGGKAASDSVMAMLWTLAYSDGEHSVLDIAEVSSLTFAAVDDAQASWPERSCWNPRDAA